MKVEELRPDPRLAAHVRRYRSRHAEFGAATTRIALPARTDLFLEFYFTAPHLIEFQATGTRAPAPWSVAVGPQTHRRVDLLLSGRIDVFTIAFEPTGLHALFGIPMRDLADEAIGAEELLGAAATRILHERLAAAPDLAGRARIADGVLLERLARRSRAPGTELVAAAIETMRRSHGTAPISAILEGGAISDRQFRRRFEAQVGIPPKLYARILRLDAALAAKSAAPQRSWTDIAHGFGWFDQAHLDKDFRVLAGGPPSRFPIR